MDKPTLEALVKRWREKESNHREWAARIPDGPRNAIDLEKSWSYGGCADELEALLSSAKPDVLIASPITAELVWTETDIQEALTAALDWGSMPVHEIVAFVMHYLKGLALREGMAPDA